MQSLRQHLRGRSGRRAEQSSTAYWAQIEENYKELTTPLNLWKRNVAVLQTVDGRAGDSEKRGNVNWNPLAPAPREGAVNCIETFDESTSLVTARFHQMRLRMMPRRSRMCK